MKKERNIYRPEKLERRNARRAKAFLRGNIG
jgi:hypothetical protein